MKDWLGCNDSISWMYFTLAAWSPKCDSLASARCRTFRLSWCVQCDLSSCPADNKSSGYTMHQSRTKCLPRLGSRSYWASATARKRERRAPMNKKWWETRFYWSISSTRIKVNLSGIRHAFTVSPLQCFRQLLRIACLSYRKSRQLRPAFNHLFSTASFPSASSQLQLNVVCVGRCIIITMPGLYLACVRSTPVTIFW